MGNVFGDIAAVAAPSFEQEGEAVGSAELVAVALVSGTMIVAVAFVKRIVVPIEMR